MPLQNFGAFGPNLWRCAQPLDVTAYTLLYQLGVRVIFKLNDDGVSVQQEMNDAYAAGLNVAPNIMNPILRLHSREQVESVVRQMVLVQARNEGLLVHCTHGRDRTGQIVAAWRVIVDGWHVNSAKVEWALYGGGVLSQIFDHPDFEVLELIAGGESA